MNVSLFPPRKKTNIISYSAITLKEKIIFMRPQFTGDV